MFFQSATSLGDEITLWCDAFNEDEDEMSEYTPGTILWKVNGIEVMPNQQLKQVNAIILLQSISQLIFLSGE